MSGIGTPYQNGRIIKEFILPAKVRDDSSMTRILRQTDPTLLWFILQTLPNRYQMVLNMTYGMGGCDVASMRQIAKELDTTVNSARNLQHTAKFRLLEAWINSCHQSLKRPNLLTDTGLSTRAINALNRAGIYQLVELTAISQQQLLASPNIGPTILDQIKQVLTNHNLEFAD